MMFRDVARCRGRQQTRRGLLAAVKDPSEVVRMAHGLTDAVAGRILPRPEGDAWGPDWLPATTPPVDALAVVLEKLAERGGGTFAPLDDDQRKAWRALPEPLQRFVVRVLVGSCEALPWLRVAFDEPFLVAALGARGPAGLASRDLYRLAARPWTDEDETQTATLSRASFEALARVDRDYLAYASVVHTMHLAVAMAGWEAARAKVDLAKVEGAALRVDTPLGAVRILGPGDDAVSGATAGAPGARPRREDTYGAIAVPSYPVAPIDVRGPRRRRTRTAATSPRR
jgi:hypothetical protein